MIRWMLLFILTLFQDTYVRIGTLLGFVTGFWSVELIQGELWVNTLAYGFVGWGIGVYLGYYHSCKMKDKRPPKL